MSAFADAITQNMVSSMDPMNRVVRDMADGMVSKQQLSLSDEVTDVIVKIEKVLADANARNASTSVIDALERQLAKVSKL